MTTALARINALDLREVALRQSGVARYGVGSDGMAVKAAVAQPINAQAVAAYSMFLSPSEITPRNSWLLYENVAPFAKVVDLIAANVAGIKPLIKIDGEPAPNPLPFQKFMSRPGYNRTMRRLIHEITVQELVTGTAYLASYGNVKYEPGALDVLKSMFVQPMHFGGYPTSYLYSEAPQLVKRFDRDGNRDYRWVDETGMAEVTPIYTMDGNRRGIGLPRLSAIKMDVELRLKGTEHNTSVMDNGARPSGALNLKSGITFDQGKDIQAQIRQEMAGSQNAGKFFVFGGGEAEWLQLSMTAKDMDWVNLIKQVEASIVTRYNVPDTIYNSESQTQNNYEVAWHMFYDQAVLPQFEVIWGGIAQLLSNRLQMDITIEPDTLSHNILARQAATRAADMYQKGLTTRNEARAMIGEEPVQGADLFMGEMPMMPGGEDDAFSDDAGQPKLDGPKKDGEKRPKAEAARDEKRVWFT